MVWCKRVHVTEQIPPQSRAVYSIHVEHGIFRDWQQQMCQLVLLIQGSGGNKVNFSDKVLDDHVEVEIYIYKCTLVAKYTVSVTYVM